MAHGDQLLHAMVTVRRPLVRTNCSTRKANNMALEASKHSERIGVTVMTVLRSCQQYRLNSDGESSCEHRQCRIVYGRSMQYLSILRQECCAKLLYDAMQC